MGRQRFLDEAEEARLVAAIRAAEHATAGEIRIHVQPRVKGDILVAAQAQFEQLGMTNTAARNGVLFFVAYADQRFCVLADEAINTRVPPGFWDQIVAEMRERFAQRDMAGALERGVRAAGQALGQHFPRQQDDRNELPNQLSRGA